MPLTLSIKPVPSKQPTDEQKQKLLALLMLLPGLPGPSHSGFERISFSTDSDGWILLMLESRTFTTHASKNSCRKIIELGIKSHGLPYTLGQEFGGPQTVPESLYPDRLSPFIPEFTFDEYADALSPSTEKPVTLAGIADRFGGEEQKLAVLKQLQEPVEPKPSDEEIRQVLQLAIRRVAAAKTGTVAELLLLIKQLRLYDGDIDASSSNGNTALTWAVQDMIKQGEAATHDKVALLLFAGAKPIIPDSPNNLVLNIKKLPGDNNPMKGFLTLGLKMLGFEEAKLFDPARNAHLQAVIGTFGDADTARFEQDLQKAMERFFPCDETPAPPAPVP